MHEWALAEAVISTADRTAREHGFGVITEIRIRLGQLQQIENEIFDMALKEVLKSRGQIYGRVNIDIQQEKAVLECNACGKKWDFSDNIGELDHARSEAIHFVPETAHSYLRCPGCGSPDFEVTKGRGVWIESITGE